MKKRRFLFLIDSLVCGGAEKSLVSLLPLLDYDRYDIDLMMIGRGGIFESYIPPQVNVVDFPNGGGWWMWICQAFNSLLIRLFPKRHYAELRWTALHTAMPRLKQTYDVAVAYQQGFPTYYVAEKVSARRKLAWVNADLVKAGYRESFNRRYYDRFDHVIAVSDQLYTMLAQASFVPAEKLVTVYDILNVDLIRRMADEEGYTDTLSDGTLRIVTVGRMSSPKNYLLAVETAHELMRRGLNFRWYFVGDGGDRPAVEQRIREYGLEDHVVLLGLKANPYPYMAQANIYVQTSTFEGFCLTLCEARLLHKPEVSTNFPVVYNQLRHEENGLIAEMNATSLADNIMRLATDDALRQHIIEATKKEHNDTARTESRKVNEMLAE